MLTYMIAHLKVEEGSSYTMEHLPCISHMLSVLQMLAIKPFAFICVLVFTLTW